MRSYVTFVLVKCLQKVDISLSGIRHIARKYFIFKFVSKVNNDFILFYSYYNCHIRSRLETPISINKKTCSFLKDPSADRQNFTLLCCASEAGYVYLKVHAKDFYLK